MTQPKAVVFDIGNVLIEWQPERLFDAAVGPERRAALFSSVDLHGMNERVDLGANFRETVVGVATQNPEHHDDVMLWHDRWIDMAQPAIAGSVHLLRALRSKGIPVFALSNFGCETFEIAKARYDFLSEFDRSFISGYMGVIKPYPEIYSRLEKDSGLAGDALIFADDRADNIAAAAARGWRTHLFEGPDGWAARLVHEGLLTEDEARF